MKHAKKTVLIWSSKSKKKKINHRGETAFTCLTLTKFISITYTHRQLQCGRKTAPLCNQYPNIYKTNRDNYVYFAVYWTCLLIQGLAMLFYTVAPSNNPYWSITASEAHIAETKTQNHFKSKAQASLPITDGKLSTTGNTEASALWHYRNLHIFTPRPVGGRDIVFARFVSFLLCFFVSFFVSLSATLRENGWTDLHEIFREGGSTRLNFRSIRVHGSAGQRSIWLLSKLLPMEFDISFALAWWQHFLPMAADKSVCLLSAWKFHSLVGSRGRILLTNCCASHHSLLLL